MKRILRWALVLVLVGLVVVGGLYWRADARATDLLEENVRILQRLKQEAPAFRGTRRTLGEPLAADAGVIYARAVERWRAISAREKDVLGWVLSRADFEWEELREGSIGLEPTPEEMVSVISRTRPAVEDLKQALRATTYDVDVMVRAMTQEDRVGHVLDLSMVVSFVAAHAAHKLHSGKVQEALDFGVLQAAAGQDLARLGGVIASVLGHGATLRGLTGLREVLAAREIDAKRLAQLAGEAEFLHAARATRDRVWHLEEIYTRKGWAEAEDQQSWLNVDVGLRYWFSHRIALAEASTEIGDLLRAAQATSTLNWRAGGETLDRLDQGLRRRENPYLRHFLYNSSWAHRSAGEVAIHTNLLRVAVAVKRYEAHTDAWPRRLADLVPAFLSEVPSCPYAGTPIGLAEDRIWSDGGDGDDDGGTPLEDESEILEDGDVVWLLKPAK